MDHHPVTGLFPLLPAEELDELAADITERGLLHPIVLDGEGRILDGRNRLAACERAGVEPEFEDYDGDDPDGYALAVNLQRRNLTKGQSAMVAAQARLVSNQTVRSAANHAGVSHARVVQATTVCDHAPDLVDQVISGVLGLDAAYEEARRRKTASESDAARLAQLREVAPELADRVVQGDLTLKGAWAEHEARVAEQERQSRVATDLLCRHLSAVANLAGARSANRYDPAKAPPTLGITAEMIDLARTAIDEIETTLKERGML